MSAAPGEPPSLLLAALTAATLSGVSADVLSRTRDAAGFTALGGAAAAGAGEWTVRTLLAAGCSAPLPGDEIGASPAELAARAGHAYLCAQLDAAATLEQLNSN